MSDLISRQAAIDALAKFVPYAICDESTESYTNGLTDAYNLICQLPSAQPELDEWCTDCKEYDAEKHCCQRWNRVIRQTLEDTHEHDAEMKQEFLRMASYIDVLLECSDEQKETLLGFISRLSEFMPWNVRD